MSISAYLEDRILDKVLRGVDFTVAAVYVSLHSADPGETGANEASGAGYARQAVTFAAAADGTSASNAVVEFSDMPAGTWTHVGLWDAPTGGNFLWGGPLTEPKATNAGDVFRLPVGNITVALD
ncbi:MAG TPA: hypothetical protein VF178_12685 [Gemmatimonadaceae bacterium]